MKLLLARTAMAAGGLIKDGVNMAIATETQERPKKPVLSGASFVRAYVGL